MGQTLDALQAGDGSLHLFTYAVDGPGTTVLWHESPEGSQEIPTQAPVERAVATLQSSGEPMLAFVQREPGLGIGPMPFANFGILRWTAEEGTARLFELGTMSTSLSPPPAPSIDLVAHGLGTGGSLVSVLVDADVHVHGLDANPILQGEAHAARGCNGRTTVYFPDICPSEVQSFDLGLRHSSPVMAEDASGRVWLASLAGSRRLSCRWSGSCFETRPCDCQQVGVPSVSGPLSLYLVELSRPERVLQLDLGMVGGGQLALATSPSGLLVTLVSWPDARTTQLHRFDVAMP